MGTSGDRFPSSRTRRPEDALDSAGHEQLRLDALTSTATTAALDDVLRPGTGSQRPSAPTAPGMHERPTSSTWASSSPRPAVIVEPGNRPPSSASTAPSSGRSMLSTRYLRRATFTSPGPASSAGRPAQLRARSHRRAAPGAHVAVIGEQRRGTALGDRARPHGPLSSARWPPHVWRSWRRRTRCLSLTTSFSGPYSMSLQFDMARLASLIA